MKTKFLTLILFTNVLLSTPAYSTEHNLSERRNDIRRFALNAAINILNFDYDNFDEQLAQNAHYFTETGCKRFIWLTDIYEFRETLNIGQAGLFTKPAKKYKLPIDYWHIQVKKLSAEELEERNIPEQEDIWSIDVPLKLVFTKDPLRQNWPFYTKIFLQKTGLQQQAYVIRWWSPVSTNNSSGITTGYQPKKRKKFKQKK